MTKECIQLVDSVEAAESHSWIRPKIGDRVFTCARCLGTKELDEPWSADDEKEMESYGPMDWATIN